MYNSMHCCEDGINDADTALSTIPGKYIPGTRIVNHHYYYCSYLYDDISRINS